MTHETKELFMYGFSLLGMAFCAYLFVIGIHWLLDKAQEIMEEK